MKDLPGTQLLSCVLFLAVICAWPTTSAISATLRADLTHVDSGSVFTNHELLRRMAARSTARTASLHSSSGRRSRTVTVPVTRSSTGKEDFNAEYNIHFGIGTPSPQRVVVSLDTGSDLIWTQCSCRVCYDQPFPVLDPSASDTYRDVPCSDPVCLDGGLPYSGCTIKKKVCFYVYAYGDHSTTVGTIAEDTFTFQAPNSTVKVAVPNLRFGCGQFNHLTIRSNESGIAGFGRGPLSLPSQLNVSSFSYCFTTIVDGKTSPMFLGPTNPKAHATGPIQATPFVPNPGPETGPSPFYYLSLTGITVGKTRLPFNASVFALKDNGDGGTIIDSGSALTSFPDAVYQSFQEAFVSQVPLPVANNSEELCFTMSSAADPKKVAVPKMIFHLEDADWELPRENYMLEVEHVNGTGTSAGLCVMINPSGQRNPTIIGNFQQQNMHIVYDLEANKMVFMPARCDQM
ncbi:unnamed protein product [Alopecurus aequalis]